MADGKIFHGESFGSPVDAEGEIVFNTSMTGYQEILTDPSYCGQMVAMTYPLIGNYGINPEDYESDRPYLSGFIIKELSSVASNWRSCQTLDEFLRKFQITGIQGVDTRSLTRHIREAGAQQAVISTQVTDPTLLVERARRSPALTGRDMVKEVTCKSPYDWLEGEWDISAGYATDPNTNSKQKPYFVVAYDFGIKRNILRKLTQAGCRVRVVPASTTADAVMAMKPDGVFLSNGPGDPEAVSYAIENTRNLLGKIPIFGICLGHQILNIAMGASTYKLRFGHHGGNQPVMGLRTRKVEITAQNHGFAVDDTNLKTEIEVNAVNLNDKTVEGVRHKKYPIISVQHHPEASPGPHDSAYLFNDFVELMKGQSK